MKKVLISIIIILTIICPSFTFADEEISVLVDDTKLVFDQPPIMENDRVLVPLRGIFEALGCNVQYIDETETVSAQKGEKKISLRICSNQLIVNDQVITIDVPAKILNDRTLVPVRAISEALDCIVGWINDTNTVTIESNHGLHTYSYQKGTKDFYADNGTVVLTVEYTMLQIDNPEGNYEINNINGKLKQDIEDYLFEVKSNVLPELISKYNREKPSKFKPYLATHSVVVNTDRKDIISVTNVDTVDVYDGNPTTQMTSYVFYTRSGLRLSLDEIFVGTVYDAMDIVTYAFRKEIVTNESLYYGDAIDTIELDFDNVQYYATDSAIVAYYDKSKISPTEKGYLKVEIPYIDNEDVFDIDFSDGGLNTLKIKLLGNAKSGYSWYCTKENTDNVIIYDTKIYDALDELASFPIGSFFEFEVTALNPGHCTLVFNYSKTGDAKILNFVKYHLFVSTDNLITVLKQE